MNRRSFLAFLAALPVVGRLLIKDQPFVEAIPPAVIAEWTGEIDGRRCHNIVCHIKFRHGSDQDTLKLCLLNTLKERLEIPSGMMRISQYYTILPLFDSSPMTHELICSMFDRDCPLGTVGPRGFIACNSIKAGEMVYIKA